MYTPQTMLLLAYASNQGDMQPYTSDCANATTQSGDITTYLNKSLNTPYGMNWKTVWGPAIFSFPVNYKGRHVDNTIYVARNGTTNDYVIGIAGTDPTSISDWVFEDFLVATTVPWFLAPGVEPRPKISLGTSIGLTLLLNITPPCAPLPGVGQKLIPFLATLTKNPVNIYTTGHSLGGALAPTLTLALDNLRLLWDLRGNASLYPFAFAGPTPGDAAFAAYFSSKFPNLQRVWNALDVVPHAWDTTHMEELPALYGKPISFVTDAVNDIVSHIGPIGYTPLNPQAATFSGAMQSPPVTNLETYLQQGAWQHTTAYSDWATSTNSANGDS
ncbi:MAG TPA: hypothetical protein VEK11_03115 [Thermoanaerobaculia bacterium]|jgi:hypothetical protein|nr:hypothetical protein [Thermoanaerobaculia bacterium]